MKAEVCGRGEGFSLSLQPGDTFWWSGRFRIPLATSLSRFRWMKNTMDDSGWMRASTLDAISTETTQDRTFACPRISAQEQDEVPRGRQRRRNKKEKTSFTRKDALGTHG